MLFGKRCFCVMCRRYKNIKRLHCVHKGIAVCDSCFAELKSTDDKTFFGTGDVKMVVSPFLYTGKMKEAVKEFKFGGQRLYGELFGKIMAEALREHTWLSEYDYIVPVPLHETRLSERGYNQSAVLAKELSRQLNVPMRSDVLFRTRNTERQSRLHGIARVENVREAFGTIGDFVKDRKIILVDDIYTMGETARSCALALKNCGAAEVVAVTLCITLNNSSEKILK